MRVFLNYVTLYRPKQVHLRGVPRFRACLACCANWGRNFMCSDELLRSSQVAASLQPSAPWRCDNLRVVEADGGGDHPSARFAVLDPEKNGHLEQVCEALEITGKGTLSINVALCADDPNRVGVNVYLYFHPTEDRDQKVYQMHHPGDGAWHDLGRDIPVPRRRVYRIRILIVARVGANGFRMGAASLRFVAALEKSLESTLRKNNISSAYHAAVMEMVDRHPSASDPAFRGKLTRYLLGSNRKGMEKVTEVETRLASFGRRVFGCRFLDLGSGSGGSLVGALEAGAAYCEGWEINGEKLALSEINVGTCGMDVGKVVVRNQSMEAPDSLGSDFQPFDIVFCEEVLEHVKDLDAAVTTLSRCIERERGVGYITMPNGFAFQSVLADPHLELFGIALLNRFEAQPLATALKNHTHYSEMMGAYCHYDDYVARFAVVGLNLAPFEKTGASRKVFKRMSADLDIIRSRRSTLRTDWGAQIGADTLGILEERLDAYLAEATARQKEATGEAATDSVREAFVRDYGQAHFAFLASGTSMIDTNQ